MAIGKPPTAPMPQSGTWTRRHLTDEHLSSKDTRHSREHARCPPAAPPETCSKTDSQSTRPPGYTCPGDLDLPATRGTCVQRPSLAGSPLPMNYRLPGKAPSKL